ncbi:hypothetical protein [Acetobacter pasteurianus]|nr:hypothetical protein NBRC3277_2809 [Acetobacter pasteurianus NBRC 3277]GCD64429.1 hypothetical protein NBRC3278_3522 [Acetobacter pasteurianus NBRC 3278]
MEVFGRTDEKYLARKAEKESYYVRVFGSDNWWLWNAADGDPIPSLPDLALNQ